MEIIMSEPRGFCAGVDRAIHVVEEALELLTPPIFVNHEIVHNSHVIDRFKEQGVIFVEDIAEVPDASNLIFNAHGVPPSLVEDAKSRGMKIVDATCPLVSRVHFAALRHAKQDRQIVLIGHKGHAEVVGIVGHAPDNIVIVEDVDDVKALDFASDIDIAYITQTTLSLHDCQVIVDALKEKYPQIVEPTKSNICYATTNRQTAIKTVAKESDFILVVGSGNSSNSRRLAEVAEACGTPAQLVNKASEVDLSWLNNDMKVGITAGASTPEDVIQGVVTFLKDNFEIDSERAVVSTVETEKFSLPKM